MGESRKADIVVRVERRDGVPRKVELFVSHQFPTGEFINTRGEVILYNQRYRYFRVRIDGVWHPGGVRLLYSKAQCWALIKGEIFDEVE